MKAESDAWVPLGSAGRPPLGSLAERRLVPLPNRGYPTSVPVVRFRSGTPTKRAVLLLSGGPGESCLDALERGIYRELLADLVQHSNVYAFDQVGVGGALPTIPPVVRWDLALAEPGRRSDVLAVARVRAAASREYWSDRGVDLARLTIASSAVDVISLLDALELGRVALFGASYGSQLAQAVLALGDARVDRAVLCNVEGLGQTLKLPQLVQRALGRALGPGRVGRLGELVTSLDTKPAAVDVSDGVTVGLSGFDLQRAVARWMGARSGLRRLSSGLDAEPSDLLRLVGREIAAWRLGPFGGIQHVIDSTTHTSASRLAQIAAERQTTALGDIADFPLPHVADPWGLKPGPPIKLSSSVPTLLVSGTHDCRTPLENLDDIRPHLSNARDLVLDGGTHQLRDYLTHARTRREVVRHLESDVA